MNEKIQIEDGYWWVKYRFEDCTVETSAEVKGNKFRLTHSSSWWSLPNDRATFIAPIPHPSPVPVVVASTDS